jgi:type II secretory pathway component PulL
MSDENNSVRYSSFWPLLILTSGFTVWCSYQLFEINRQRIAYNAQYESLAPLIAPSQNAQAKLRAIVEDLIQTSGKDQYAAQILKESIQAGIIHVNKNGNTTATPAEPAK